MNFAAPVALDHSPLHSCNITKVDKTLILSILAIYNSSIQSFVTFGVFIKVNIYHMYLYINSYSHIVPSSEAHYSLTLCSYVDHKK